MAGIPSYELTNKYQNKQHWPSTASPLVDKVPCWPARSAFRYIININIIINIILNLNKYIYIYIYIRHRASHGRAFWCPGCRSDASILYFVFVAKYHDFVLLTFWYENLILKTNKQPEGKAWRKRWKGRMEGNACRNSEGITVVPGTPKFPNLDRTTPPLNVDLGEFHWN